MAAMALWLLLSYALAEEIPWSQVALAGRWEDRTSSWATGSFGVRFRGSSRLLVRLESEKSLYYTCQVDDGTPFVLKHHFGDLIMDLSPEEHTVRCGRNTEAFYGASSVRALRLDQGAEVLSPPSSALPQVSSRPLKLEFLGDSITCGWKVLLPPGSWSQSGPDYEDVFRSYAAQLSRLWRAEWRSVAQTSIGVLGHRSFGLTFKPFVEQYLCSGFAAGSCPRPWDFHLWQADVVVMNLGTNDFVFNNPTEAEFRGAYLDLLRTVRSKYPEALVFGVMPLIRSCKFGPEWDAKMEVLATGLRSAVAAMDSKVRLVDTGDKTRPWLNCQADYVDEIHPTEQGSLIFAQKLAEVLTDTVRQFYPEKCPGTGSSCGSGPVPRATTSVGGTSTTAATTTVGGPTTTAAGASCCYPSCSSETCNSEAESPFCTSSAANCRQCGGELCGASATTGVTTTAQGTTGAGAQCCYPDCVAQDRACNPSENYCSSSPSICASCGGSLCGAASTTAGASTTGVPSTGSRCCYPDCGSSVCNDEEESPYCTSSPEHCRTCGGQLCP